MKNVFGILGFITLVSFVSCNALKKEGNSAVKESAGIEINKDSVIRIPGVESYNLNTGNFLLEIEIQADPSFKSHYSCLFSPRVKGGWSAPYLFGLWKDNGLPYVYLGSGKGGNVGYKKSDNKSKDLRDGVWHKVAYRSENGVLEIYVDSVMVFSQDRGKNGVKPDFSKGITIGGDLPSDYNTKFVGKIKNVKVWDFAQKPNTKIKSNSTKGLIGYWRLDGSSEQPLEDLSPLKNNATWLKL